MRNFIICSIRIQNTGHSEHFLGAKKRTFLSKEIMFLGVKITTNTLSYLVGGVTPASSLL
jgi:hypothetical protein